jgi:hypothetical protein
MAYIESAGFSVKRTGVLTVWLTACDVRSVIDVACPVWATVEIYDEDDNIIDRYKFEGLETYVKQCVTVSTDLYYTNYNSGWYAVITLKEGQILTACLTEKVVDSRTVPLDTTYRPPPKTLPEEIQQYIKYAGYITLTALAVYLIVPAFRKGGTK